MNPFRNSWGMICLWVLGLLVNSFTYADTDKLNPATFQLDGEGYTSAVSQLDEQLDSLDMESDATLWTKTLLRSARLRAMEGKHASAVHYLQLQEWPTQSVPQVILKVALTQEAQAYLDHNNWQVVPHSGRNLLLETRRRQQYELLLDTVSENFQSAFELSSKDHLTLQQASDYLTEGEFPTHIRGFLVDWVAEQWIAFLSDDLYWRKAQREAGLPPLSQLLDLQSPVKVDKALHPLKQIQQISASLYQWHHQAGRQEAAFEVVRHLTIVLSRYFSNENEIGLLSEKLDQQLKQLGPHHPWWSMGKFQQALFRQQMPHKSALLEAHGLAVKASIAHPGSMGAQRSQTLLSELEYQEFSVSGQRASAVGQASLKVAYRNLYRLFFKAWRVDAPLPASLSEEQQRAVVDELLSRPADVEWESKLPDFADLNHHSTQLVPEVSENGQWLLMASPQAEFSDVISKLQLLNLHLSDYVASVSYFDGEFRVAVYDGKLGRALPNISTELLAIESNATKVLSQTKTNVHGIARLKREQEADHFQVRLSHGVDASVIDIPGLLPLQDERIWASQSASAVIVTNRSVYRGGDKVMWSLIAKANEGARQPGMTVKANQAGWIRVYNPQNEMVLEQAINTDQSGVASGSFQLATKPTEKLNGFWHMASSWQGRQQFEVSDTTRSRDAVRKTQQARPLASPDAIRGASLSIQSSKAFFEAGENVSLSLEKRQHQKQSDQSGMAQNDTYRWFVYELIPPRNDITHSFGAPSMTLGALRQNGTMMFAETDNAVLNFQGLPAGLYRVRILAQNDHRDTHNMTSQQSKVIAAQELDFMVVEPGSGKAIKAGNMLLAQQSVAQVGGSLKLLAGSGIEGQWVRLSVVKAGKVLASHMLSPGLHILDFPILESHQGGLEFSLEWVEQNQIYHESIQVKVPWTSKQLTLSAAPTGEHWQLQAMRADGTAFAAEGSSVVVVYENAESASSVTWADLAALYEPTGTSMIRLDNNGETYPYYFRGSRHLVSKAQPPLKHPQIRYQDANDAQDHSVDNFDILPLVITDMDSGTAGYSLGSVDGGTKSMISAGSAMVTKASQATPLMQRATLNAEGFLHLKIPETFKGQAVRAKALVVSPTLETGQMSVVIPASW